MIIDAHHHLWHYNPTDYGWMDDSMTLLKRDYLPADLEPHLIESGVSGTIVVQARQSIEETRWLLQLAEEYPFIRGVVGWVDLRSERVEEQLDTFSVHPKLVGVRHVIQDEPDEDFMLGPEFRRGIGKLQNYGLAYDLLLFPRHLRNAVKLAQQFPEQRFVLDHIAKPFIKSRILQPWKADLKALAGQPNVWCKISGMVTEEDADNWKYEDFVPYLDAVTEAFGTGRLMLGSDWPVCRLAGEYGAVMKIPVRYFESLNNSEKERIFKYNCIEFYGLD
ncbi:MAG: amidohydrolase family protein [Bacteroidales bacterium]|nr:amidohydrolase family protein [Bacteroidales bacterium]